MISVYFLLDYLSFRLQRSLEWDSSLVSRGMFLVAKGGEWASHSDDLALRRKQFQFVFPKRNSWFLGWKLLVSRAKCVGFSCRMRCLPVQDAHLFGQKGPVFP